MQMFTCTGLNSRYPSLLKMCTLSLAKYSSVLNIHLEYNQPRRARREKMLISVLYMCACAGICVCVCPAICVRVCPSILQSLYVSYNLYRLLELFFWALPETSAKDKVRHVTLILLLLYMGSQEVILMLDSISSPSANKDRSSCILPVSGWLDHKRE